MERDPVRFVWRHARGANALIVVLAVLLIVPGVWIVCEAIRTAIDDVLLGRAYAGGRAVAAFLQLRLAFPERVLDEPLTLSPGLPLGRHALASAVVGTLALGALLTAAGVLVIGLLRIRVSRASVRGLEKRLVAAISDAAPASFETARHAAQLAGDAIAAEAATLGRVIAQPGVAGAALAGALLVLVATDWRMALVTLVGLALFVWAARLSRRAEGRFGEARRVAAAGLSRRMEDLARRLPALAAHGTAALERSRFEEEARPALQPLGRLDRSAVLADAVALLAALVAPVGAVAVGLWSEQAGGASPGRVIAAGAASSVGVLALGAILLWRRDVARLEPFLDEIAQALGSLNARRGGGAAPPLPASGVLQADTLSASDPSHGGAIADLDLQLSLPSHVALLAGEGPEAGLLAAVMAGQIAPEAGRMTFGGVDVVAADPADRARRLAFAGGEPYLIPDSLRANLLYGCPDPHAEDVGRELHAALDVVGLNAFVYRRGLLATIDPRQEPELAAGLVEARRSIREALLRPNLAGLVEAFDSERYNHQATIGENILFGVPVGDTFREANLASQPFMRGLLEREGLAGPLAELGAAVARATLELFGEVEGGSPILERFAPASRAERRALEQILERRDAGRRGHLATRDAEHLIGLALRYSETRQRLGLLDADLETRLVHARRTFAQTVPDSLRPALEFFDGETYCSAATLADNLLFGRIVQSRAGAKEAIVRLVRRTLDEYGLGLDVVRLGLEARLGVGDAGPREAALIDLARCLVRRPDNLVVERAIELVGPGDAARLVARLRDAMAGRGLIVVLGQALDRAALPPFDALVDCTTGSPVTRSAPEESAQKVPPSPLTRAPAHTGASPAAIG